jgi:hypothetical protein
MALTVVRTRNYSSRPVSAKSAVLLTSQAKAIAVARNFRFRG